MRQAMRDLNDLIKEEPYREKIKLEDIDRYKAKRYKKEAYRKAIRNYLRRYHKPIGMLPKEDIAIMTEWMDAVDRTLFMDEVKHSLETNRGKPISRIAQNNKSILFSKK